MIDGPSEVLAKGPGDVKGVLIGGAAIILRRRGGLGFGESEGCAEVEKLAVTGVVLRVEGMPHMVDSSDGVYEGGGSLCQESTRESEGSVVVRSWEKLNQLSYPNPIYRYY